MADLDGFSESLYIPVIKLPFPCDNPIYFLLHVSAIENIWFGIKIASRLIRRQPPSKTNTGRRYVQDI